jgi:Domain of unknown function (DUF6851)/VCPO second helical-bundle domain
MTEDVSSGWTRRVFRSYGLAVLAAAVMIVSANASQARSLEEQDAIRGYFHHMLMRGQQKDSVVIKWNDVCLEAIRITRPGPPVVARALAMLHTAIYDAWAAYDRRALGTRFGSTLRRPAKEATKANKINAVSFAAYRVLVDLFPSERPRFGQLMVGLGFDPSDQSADATKPTGIGNVVAKAILDFRHADGSNQSGGYADTTGYQPVNTPDAILDPNRWQPLRVPTAAGGFIVQSFSQPHWENVTPFALTSASQFRPGPPKLLPDDERGYRQQAEQIIRTSAQLTDRTKAISEYWADGPSSEQPPGHWTLFAEFVSRRDRHTLGEDVRLFFAMANALLDAGISAWEAKRFYDYVRPISAIHYLFAGRQILAWAGPYQGTKWILGDEWQPYRAPMFGTPPFSEYISGHSTFSAAAAEVLKQFTGSDRFDNEVTISAGSSLIEPGAVPATDITLRWPTFSAAADEAGISRRYGGIHFLDGDLQGREVGRAVSQQAWRKARRYFNSHKDGDSDEDRDDHDCDHDKEENARGLVARTPARPAASHASASR